MYGYRQPSAVIPISSDSALLYLHLTAKVRKIKQSKAETYINPISGKVTPYTENISIIYCDITFSYIIILNSHNI